MAGALESYRESIARKRVEHPDCGIADVPALNPAMFPHQAHSTEFALRKGRAALFLDTGLGKSLCALEWGRVIVERTNRPVLMLAPLAVAAQHQREAQKFGIDGRAIRAPSEIAGPAVYITNYELLGKFDPDLFAGAVLDESSIIKSFTGATTRALNAAFGRTDYRLACTATPAPNDHMELGQHSQFLGVMASNEMLTRWFIADQTDMGRYRLKAPAARPFWDWVSSWARCISRPSDLGFSDEGFVLPELRIREHIVRVNRPPPGCGFFDDGSGAGLSATNLHRDKRETVEARADRVAELVAFEPDEPWLVWCDTDYEADALMARLPSAVEVRGSMHPDLKEERLMAFVDGEAKILITKPRIAGYGLNLQHCARMAFVGLSYSYEAFYQAVRRCWRFGQARPVEAHVVMADSEYAIVAAITRKTADHDAMKREMTAAMRRSAIERRVLEPYAPALPAELPTFLRAS